MRIGIESTTWINRRGFGRFLRELIGGLTELGSSDEFVLICDRQSAEMGGFPSDWEVIGAKTREAQSRAASARGRRTLGDLWSMRGAVRAAGLDVIYFPAVYSWFPVGGRTPTVVTFHDVIAETLPHLIFHTRRHRLFWNLKCRMAARTATRVVTVSQASSEGLERVFGLPRERLGVVSEAPSSVFRVSDESDPAHRTTLARYGLVDPTQYFLSVGGISPHKNLDRLIRAFAVVRQARSAQDLQLILVGDYQGDVFRTCHDDLRGLADRLKLGESIRFVGFVPDESLRHLYSGAAAFVFPSLMEGFGLPAVEAMACGAPVLASDRSSLPEVLGGAGLLFDPLDEQAMVGAMNRILDEPEFRLSLRERGLARSREFSWKRSAEQLLTILHELNDR